jgi:diguanylate cyclase (GGDEF)-like protein
MSGAINTALEFITQNALEMGVGLAVLLTLFFIIRFYRPSPRFKPSKNGVPSRTVLGGTESDDVRRRYQSIVDDLHSDLRGLKERIAHLTNLNSILAPLIKEMNANVDRDRMGPIVLRVLERVFQPKQALFFVSDQAEEFLTLVSGFGIEDVSDGYQQAFGEGFAGVVARKRVVMGTNDLRYESNLTRQRLTETEPSEFITDTAAPIVHLGRTLGVLCIGGVGNLNEDDRALFGMIGDMTALALTNYIQYRKIQELANSDPPMTRIYNKGYFIKHATSELALARTGKWEMSILMIDLDNFKHYNDTNGHLAGDRLLQSMAGIFREQTREQDTVARFGGEEFVILLHGIGGQTAMDAAERIREAIASFPFPNGDRQPLGHVSASIGVSTFPADGMDLELLILKADEALYAAKEAGRDRVMCASGEVERIDFGSEESVERQSA